MAPGSGTSVRRRGRHVCTMYAGAFAQLMAGKLRIGTRNFSPMPCCRQSRRQRPPSEAPSSLWLRSMRRISLHVVHFQDLEVISGSGRD